MIAFFGITPLEVLGLKPGASLDDVGGAFRRLARVVHPDVCPGGAGLLRLLVAARDSALSAPSAPERPGFHWYRAMPGQICCGMDEGVLTVYRSPEGWRWVLPDGLRSLRGWGDPSEARSSAEEAFLLKYRP
jgi:curved DNA-binding protein CbpA